MKSGRRAQSLCLAQLDELRELTLRIFFCWKHLVTAHVAVQTAWDVLLIVLTAFFPSPSPRAALPFAGHGFKFGVGGFGAVNPSWVPCSAWWKVLNWAQVQV